MALTNCKECGGMVSTLAPACPHCGLPQKGEYVPVKNVVVRKRNFKRLPNGFGTIKRRSGNLRKPYVVYPPCKQYTVNGSPILEKPIGTYETYNEAYSALVDYNRSPYDTTARSVKFREIYQMYYDDKFVNNKKREYSKSSLALANMVYDHCGSILDKDFNKVTSKDLQDMIDNLTLRHAGQEAILTNIKSLYKYAVIHGLSDKNVAEFITIKIADDDVKGIPFTADDINALWEKAETDDMAKLIIMLIYTGFRINEFLKAEYNSVTNCFVGGSKTRSGKNRIVPVHKDIVEFLPVWQEWKKRSYPHFKNCSYECLASLKIDYVGETKHTLHDCRHTFSWLCDKYKVDDFSKHLILGHSLGNDVEKSVYGHRTIKELTDEINKLEKVVE